MRVEVHLYATLAEARPDTRAGEPIDLELPPATSLLELLQRLGIEPGAVHLVIIDGRVVRDRARPLAEGERIALFPPVGGG